MSYFTIVAREEVIYYKEGDPRRFVEPLTDYNDKITGKWRFLPSNDILIEIKE